MQAPQAVTGIPPGLEYMGNLDQIIVKQRIELMEGMQQLFYVIVSVFILSSLLSFFVIVAFVVLSSLLPSLCHRSCRCFVIVAVIVCHRCCRYFVIVAVVVISSLSSLVCHRCVRCSISNNSFI